MLFATDTLDGNHYQTAEAFIDKKNKEIRFNTLYKNKGVYENQQNKKMRPSKVSNDRNVPAPTPEAQSFPGLNDNISDAEENVNEKGPRYSLSLENSYDSDGRQLTSQQQEYFKESKVRDEDGNLRVVYHGTDQNFTVFDRLTRVGIRRGVKLLLKKNRRSGLEKVF